MEADEHLKAAMSIVDERAEQRTRDAIAAGILIGPFEDGFAIFLGGYRIGKFPTRQLACDSGSNLALAIRSYQREEMQLRRARARGGS